MNVLATLYLIQEAWNKVQISFKTPIPYQIFFCNFEEEIGTDFNAEDDLLLITGRGETVNGSNLANYWLDFKKVVGSKASLMKLTKL